jgi:hypothetical protein
MGLRPTRDNEYQRRPRASGDPLPVDSRLRGNDVTFGGAVGDEGSRSTEKLELPGFLASLRMTVWEVLSVWHWGLGGWPMEEGLEPTTPCLPLYRGEGLQAYLANWLTVSSAATSGNET